MKGKVCFVRGKDASETVENPTWLDVAAYADEMIHLTRADHCFLKAIERARTVGGIKIVKLVMGS